MPMPLYSNGVTRRTLAADAVVQHDLAVNPLSVVMLNLRPLNETSTLSNYADVLQIATAINSVQILFRGEAIKSFAGGIDIMAYNWFRWGIMPWEANGADTDNERRSVSIPIIMGRNAYDPQSCFPATHRGELSIQLDLDVADTGYDNFDYSIDFVELLDAKPSEYEKNVNQNITYNATGDQDVDLPIGNVFRNILAFGTTGYSGATPASTLGAMKVLLGNQEKHYTRIDFETAAVMSMLWGRQGPFVRHAHRTDASGASATATTFASATRLVGGDPTGLGNYAWLDFDPTKDDTWSLDTKGQNRFHVRCTVGTANAARFIPTEVIKTPGGNPY